MSESSREPVVRWTISKRSYEGVSFTRLVVGPDTARVEVMPVSEHVAVLAERDRRTAILLEAREAMERVLKLCDADYNAAYDLADDVRGEVGEALRMASTVCPTCGGVGPDQADSVGDYGGGPYEARCGDDWHDKFDPALSPDGSARG